MKETYFDFMERAVSAYDRVHIVRYFESVKENGLSEHGFARLVSNLGILIAHGRCLQHKELFLQMMDFCCGEIPKGHAANDFSVREVVCALRELEASGAVEASRIDGWKAALASIDPTVCYDVYAKTPTDPVRNWALFTGVSEYFRQRYGLCDSTEFIETQIASQLQWFDENGMYMDHSGTEVHQPIVYDLVPRGLFCLLLYFGYDGKYRETVDAILRKSALCTLKMQSPNGEIPFGGRSNQFLHNEAWLAIVFEFEARRYEREGNGELAAKFRAGVLRALRVVEEWLMRDPIRHIKNRFPTETKFGCEKYAYFDKYMVTVSSFLYAASLLSAEAERYAEIEDIAPCAFETSAHFHKVFLKCGGYGLEFDTNADLAYDASGLGRIHRAGAPSTVALSVPCPSRPKYVLNTDTPQALSVSPCVFTEEKWHFSTEVPWTLLTLSEESDSACARFSCAPHPLRTVESSYVLSKDGVMMHAEGEGRIGFLLPAFSFDGEVSPVITAEVHALTVSYRGWICRYETDGEILDLESTAANRNGCYRAFIASGQDSLSLKVTLCEVTETD